MWLLSFHMSHHQVDISYLGRYVPSETDLIASCGVATALCLLRSQHAFGHLKIDVREFFTITHKTTAYFLKTANDVWKILHYYLSFNYPLTFLTNEYSENYLPNGYLLVHSSSFSTLGTTSDPGSSFRHSIFMFNPLCFMASSTSWWTTGMTGIFLQYRIQNNCGHLEVYCAMNYIYISASLSKKRKERGL